MTVQDPRADQTIELSVRQPAAGVSVLAVSGEVDMVSAPSLREALMNGLADGGIFVVVRSSNPEGRELQHAKLPNGESVAANLSRLITERNAKVASGMGPIGAVVGATCEDAAQTVEQLPSAFILAPGVGAQGATMQDVLKRMPAARGRVLPNVSRAILANGTSEADIRATITALQEQARSLL